MQPIHATTPIKIINSMAAPLHVRELSHCAAELFPEETLGVGSYGKVCRAKCGQLPCAAKLLHDTMFGTNDPGVNKFVEQFEQECRFLRMIKHPNIVQFLGTVRDPKSRRLALLMELMDESLTRFLERSTGPLPYHTQLNICHDVALALAYLHSNDIIHRDLSSNNVLLIGQGSRAKVTDFGMSKLVGMNPRMTPLTMCPGTSFYMAPEALIMTPKYSNKLDCFSYGVLTIQIANRQFPDPGDAHSYVEDPKYPNERLLRPVPETQRRKKDIDLVDPNHPLLPPALHCLKDRDKERPSADELCGRLAALKDDQMYTQSMEQSREQSVSVQKLQKRFQDELEATKAKHKTEIAELKETHEKELEEKVAAISKHYESLVKQLQGENQPKDSVVATDSIKLTWRRGKTAPADLSALRGMAVVHDNTAYFSLENKVYSYTAASDEWWTEQRPCEYSNFGLAVVSDKITTIGGCDTDSRAVNALLCLSGGWLGFGTKWRELLPRMPTARVRPSTVTIPTHLIVAGGWTGLRGDALSKVEILDLDTLQWSSARSLPQALQYPHLILCSGHLYFSENGTVFTSPVKDLLKSASVNSSVSGSVWTKLTDVPVPYRASLVTMRDEVLAVGGREKQFVGAPTGAIYRYDRSTNSWSVIGEMPTPRYNTLVAVLPSDELLVVGGRDNEDQCNITEIANIDY